MRGPRQTEAVDPICMAKTTTIDGDSPLALRWKVNYLVNALSETRRLASARALRRSPILVLEDAGDYLAPDGK